MSTLVGIAVKQGIIDRLDRPIIDYLPDLPLADSDQRLARITIEHLLTMTAGFAWDEGDDDAVSDWFFSGNRSPPQDAVTRPIIHEPGTVFNYDSPSANLLATLLARVLGRDLRSFADEHLFLPLVMQIVS